MIHLCRLLLISSLFFLTQANAAFNGLSVESQPTNLSSHMQRDRWTLVAIWSLDCVTCEQQKPDLSAINTRLGNLTVVGLSIDGTDQMKAVRNRLAKRPVSFDNIVLNYGDFAAEYEQRFQRPYTATPTYILFNPDYEVKSINVGPLDFSTLETYLKKNTKAANVRHGADLMR